MTANLGLGHYPKNAVVSRNITDENGDPLDRIQFGRVIRVTECDHDVARDLGFENIVEHQWCVYEVDFAAVEDLKIPATVEEIYAPELRFEDEPDAEGECEFCASVPHAEVPNA